MIMFLKNHLGTSKLGRQSLQGLWEGLIRRETYGICQLNPQCLLVRQFLGNFSWSSLLPYLLSNFFNLLLQKSVWYFIQILLWMVGLAAESLLVLCYFALSAFWFLWNHFLSILSFSELSKSLHFFFINFCFGFMYTWNIFSLLAQSF